MAATATTTKRPNWMMDRVLESVGKYINLETSDGVRREGKLSGVSMSSMTFNGAQVDIPTELELNGDPSDIVELARIRILNIT